MIDKVVYAILILVLAFPAQVFASVLLSEVMYDLDGADSNREWIEIFNSDVSTVSLSGWKFYEDETNHKLTLIQGNESLASGEYAIIVDDSDTFLLDWPGYTGTIFDSSFSLSNTGETLIIRDSELLDIDSVTYISDWGAKGDGDSLYYTGSEWSFGGSTPGSGQLSEDVPPSSEEGGEEGGSEESPSPSGSVGAFPVEQQIFAYINSLGGETEEENRTVTVGADSLFKGTGTGLTGEVLSGARFQWSFGDGSSEEGESVLHYYRYPGEYLVVLNVSSGEYSATDRIQVSALPARVFITNADKDRIELSNQSDREINLSWWMFRIEGERFIIPENTIILPNKFVSFSSEVTKLYPDDTSEVSLLYPNGSMVVLDEKLSDTVVIGKVVEGIGQAQSVSYPSSQSIVGKEIPVTLVSVESDVSSKEVPIEIEVRKEEEKEAEGEISQENQQAAVSSAVDLKERSRFIYWLALVGMIVLGSTSVLFLRKKSREEITIIE